MERILVSIIEVMLIGLSISYFFVSTHRLRYGYNKTFILFYICFLLFYVLSLSFYNEYIVMSVYVFISLFIISHICFDESLKKRIMMLGVFSLIYLVEEMLSVVVSYLIFKSNLGSYEMSTSLMIFKMCIRNLQLFGYCFFVEELFSKQFYFFKPFYLIPVGQAIMLLMIYYLGVIKCDLILEYIFIVCALLIFWCDYILYNAFLNVRIEKISDIKYVQSKMFTDKQNELKKLKHDLMNHYSVLEIMINNNDQQGVNEYMKKMKELYKEDTYDV